LLVLVLVATLLVATADELTELVMIELTGDEEEDAATRVEDEAEEE